MKVNPFSLLLGICPQRTALRICSSGTCQISLATEGTTQHDMSLAPWISTMSRTGGAAGIIDRRGNSPSRAVSSGNSRSYKDLARPGRCAGTMVPLPHRWGRSTSRQTPICARSIVVAGPVEPLRPTNAAIPQTECRGKLARMDSNHDKVIQSHLCYRYTTGQGGVESDDISDVPPIKPGRTLAR